MIKRLAICASTAFVFGTTLVFAQQTPAPKTVGDDAANVAIRSFVKSYVDAFNQRNVDAITAMWSEQCTYIDRETGERTDGRDSVRADLTKVFQERPNTRLDGRVDRVRLIKPDVARVEGETVLNIPTDAPSVAVFTAVLIKSGKQWQIDSMEESPLPQPATAAEALGDLDWLVGKWVDEAGDTRVDTTFRWSTNRSFLIRSYLVQFADGVTQQGTQLIGWDPRSQQIRSWKFDSDGSFGDAIWTESDGDWLIRSTQTLADGRAASGTYVMKRTDDDTMSVKLVGHEIEGEPVPSTGPVTVVRVADATDDTTTSSTSALDNR